MEGIRNMKLFTVGELWGPFQCDYPGCDEMTFTLRLTDVEYESLPVKYGSEAINIIFDKEMGKAVCTKHTNEEIPTSAAPSGSPTNEGQQVPEGE